MLTSKEIIERTGISRATLNNYIASGLVPRPQVLPPGPEQGAAPRIGFFPDDTIARVEEIQRLTRETTTALAQENRVKAESYRRKMAETAAEPERARQWMLDASMISNVRRHPLPPRKGRWALG